MSSSNSKEVSKQPRRMEYSWGTYPPVLVNKSTSAEKQQRPHRYTLMVYVFSGYSKSRTTSQGARTPGTRSTSMLQCIQLQNLGLPLPLHSYRYEHVRHFFSTVLRFCIFNWGLSSITWSVHNNFQTNRPRTRERVSLQSDSLFWWIVPWNFWTYSESYSAK